MAHGEVKETHNGNMLEKIEAGSNVSSDFVNEEELDNPNVHHSMNFRLFMSLVAMSFLWVGSQIPLYLYGSVLPTIYSDINGVEIYLWMIIGYLIPLAALCPFVGALSDMFGRKAVGATGQILLMIGPIIVSTAKSMNVAILGMVICGLGAGLNELIALAGTSELVPIKKRPMYVGAVVFTILPFCPSALWAELITISNWRYNGVLIGVWNLVGLVLLMVFYKDPASLLPKASTNKEILSRIDWIGAFLSVSGVILFMLGLQWGAQQYTWTSPNVLVPFVLGIVVIIAFFIWETKAPYPMVPKELFSKDKRSMILILLITFFSGGNFFVVLLFWPTQAHNMYSPDPVQVGVRTLPVGFGIILGAVVCLLAIGLTKGKTTIIMIFSTAIMTLTTGLMVMARTDNLNSTVIPIITFASISVGAVIIPCSIIAQLITPTKLIGTITAISLSIRYIGGAIAFTAYYNVFYNKFLPLATPIAIQSIKDGYCTGANYTVLVNFVTYAAQAQFDDLRTLIATEPSILKKETAFTYITGMTQKAFAVAYQYPYYISIAFGGVCFFLSFGLRNIGKYM